MSTAVILVAGLTPAWQRIMVFDALRTGAVNRARRVEECASGKPVNAALALRSLGAPVRLLTAAGGARGDLLLRDLRRIGLRTRPIRTSAPTRLCITLLVKGRATELVEEAGAARPGELAAFASAFRREAARARAIVLCGSLPRGTPPAFYRRLLAGVRAPVVLDAKGPELLEALSRRPFVVKPNRRELAAALGRALPDERSLRAAMAELNERGAGWVVVTDGAGPVRVRGGGRTWTLPTSRVKAVNPIGCGDCLAAGIALGIVQGRDPVDAVRLGIAAAADRLGRVLPSRQDVRRARLIPCTAGRRSAGP